MDYVERVARAIHASKAFQPTSGPWQGNGRASEIHAMDAAQAAITAYEGEPDGPPIPFDEVCQMLRPGLRAAADRLTKVNPLMLAAE